jgi:hypothetical protein
MEICKWACWGQWRFRSSQANKIARKYGVDLSSFNDGRDAGAIHNNWNIHCWPCLAVVDANGVIPSRNERGAALRETVKTLLKANYFLLAA